MNTYWRLLILTLHVVFGSALSNQNVTLENSLCPEGSSGSLEGPNPIPPGGGTWTCSVTVSAGAGLGVNITLDQLNLDANLGDYLSINAGQSRDLRSSAVFSWKISEPLQLVIPSRESFFVLLHIGSRIAVQSANSIGFHLTYDTFEAPTPAPPTTTTKLPLPTPPDEETRPNIKVYVGGSKPDEFVQRLDEFRSTVANVSNVFCDKNDIILRRPIWAEHVVIESMQECPSNWPEGDVCVEVVMAVPAFTTANSSYELSALHLRQMWNLMRNGNHLPQPWYVFEPPDAPTAVIWWACVFFGIVILFLLLIVLAWRVEILQSSNRKFRKPPSVANDSLWPKTDMTVSAAGVPPYLTLEQPPEDAPSRKFYYEERHSYARQEGFVNDAFDQEEYGDLDIVHSRNYNQYIYDDPDAELDYDDKKTAIVLGKDDGQSETTL